MYLTYIYVCYNIVNRKKEEEKNANSSQLYCKSRANTYRHITNVFEQSGHPAMVQHGGWPISTT